MPIYVAETILSFNVNDKSECEYQLNDTKQCPNEKLCRGTKCFRSVNINKDLKQLMQETLK